MRDLALTLLALALVAPFIPAASAGTAPGSQTWHLTDSPGCADPSDLVGPSNEGLLRMDRQGSTDNVGAGDVIVAPGSPVVFCANEPAAVSVGFRGDFLAHLVFREPHPLPTEAILSLCENGLVTSLTDRLGEYLVLRLGVYRAGVGFVEKAELSKVYACHEYQPILGLETTPGVQVTINETLWSTGAEPLLFDDMDFIIEKGDYLALQVEKAVAQLPAGADVSLAATLVTTARSPYLTIPPEPSSSGLGGLPGLAPAPAGIPLPIDQTYSPSVLTSPDADPGYPVPELPTLALAGLGLVAVGLVTRRRA